MRLDLPFAQQLRNILRYCALPLCLGIAGAFPLRAQTQKPDLPDPIKFVNKFEVVANVARAVLDDMGFAIELEDRKGGRIVTRPYEFITGSLTSSEVEKYAVKNEILTGSWLKARYSAEIILEIVSPAETMVTVRSMVEALNRNVDATEKWIRLDSLGTLERRVLGRISTKLMGSDVPSNERKGFWGKKPQPVDPRQPKFPTPSR